MALKNTQVILTINGGEEKYLGTGSTTASFPGANPLFQGSNSLVDGSGSNKAQKVGLASFSLSGGASVTLDLTAFAGPFGNVNFSLVKECICTNLSADATNVIEVGGAAADPWLSPFAGTTPRGKLHPGTPAAGRIEFNSPLVGYAVSGTNKNIKLANIGAATNVATGNVIVIGEGT